MSRPCVVGLTGGLASGKSTVAGLLAELGAAVIDADRVVHDLYGPGQPGAHAVAERFGTDLLAPDGSVDRDRLAGLVASDPGARKVLEALIHPLVRERIRAWISELGEGGEAPPVAVVEATLMVETGSWRDHDLLVVVSCRPEQQLERAVARGMPEERARALLAAQLPLAEKVALADVVVDNSGPPEVLPARVREAWTRILELCRERGRSLPGGRGSIAR